MPGCIVVAIENSINGSAIFHVGKLMILLVGHLFSRRILVIARETQRLAIERMPKLRGFQRFHGGIRGVEMPVEQIAGGDGTAKHGSQGACASRRELHAFAFITLDRLCGINR